MLLAPPPQIKIAEKTRSSFFTDAKRLNTPNPTRLAAAVGDHSGSSSLALLK
jgi:hypothetical protein